MKIGIFQFHGCTKCFGETLLLTKHLSSKMPQINWIDKPSTWKSEPLDIAVITGYLYPEDRKLLQKIRDKTTRVIAYGSCPVSGGIFGLAYQKGIEISPIKTLIPDSELVAGCLGEIEELAEKIMQQPFSKQKPLCNICPRSSTPQYLDQIHRQIDPTAEETKCYNDQGFLCNGYVARHCKELCINFGAPCRGCKATIDRPGLRMIGMFGTFMGNIEVATEATGKGATDKLADREDAITEGLPDVTGNFFRYDLPQSSFPLGRQISTGNIYSDIFIGRTLEEIPLILGSIGGDKSISWTIQALNAYEQNEASEIIVSETTRQLRDLLLKLEYQLQQAIQQKNYAAYLQITEQIRSIAGNMNLSNLFFGGFRTPVTQEPDHSLYKPTIFEPQAGTYHHGLISYTINPQGIITAFQVEGTQ